MLWLWPCTCPQNLGGQMCAFQSRTAQQFELFTSFCLELFHSFSPPFYTKVKHACHRKLGKYWKRMENKINFVIAHYSTIQIWMPLNIWCISFLFSYLYKHSRIHFISKVWVKLSIWYYLFYFGLFGNDLYSVMKNYQHDIFNGCLYSIMELFIIYLTDPLLLNI